MPSLQGVYQPDQSESVDLGAGVVHLYKEGEQSETTGCIKDGADDLIRAQHVVAILAVPSYMTTADLLGFFGGYVSGMANIRLVRTAKLNRFMGLIRFRRAKDAKAFRNDYNGKAFNSIDAETCHVVRIRSLSFQGSILEPEAFPRIVARDDHSQHHAANGENTVIRPLPPATGALVELPTCVICLERMDDSVTGLLTILCDHTFHCSCIRKWVETQSTCPVCRFSNARAVLESKEPQACNICLAEKNLWMCLICGNVACGRYESQHAIAHFTACEHAFAMDLESGRIWDYASDAYVHRLVQEKMDAKPSASKQSFWQGKLESDHTDGGSEFEQLLATQLESQRLYYEDQVRTAAARASAQAKELGTLSSKIEQLQLSRSSSEARLQESKQECAASRTASQKSETRALSLAGLARRLEQQYKEEKSINDSLMQRILYLEHQLDAQQQKERSIELERDELKEELRDLLLHLSSQDAISHLDAESRCELQGGALRVGQLSRFKR
ncbi:hypothetical protein PYCC9005_004191 [Savitreella phatthalungensis]